MIPKPDKADSFKIRRNFAYLVLIYCLVWPLLILTVYTWKGMDAATVTDWIRWV